MRHIGLRVFGAPSLSKMLYFDEIALVGFGLESLESQLGVSRTRDESARIDYLATKGVVVDVNAILDRPDTRAVLETWRRTILRRLQVSNAAMNAPSDTSAGPDEIVESTALGKTVLIQRLRGELEKVLAIPYRKAFESHGEYAPSTVLSGHFVYEDHDPDARALEVILKRFPMPANDVPLEAVLDFRSNPEAQVALRQLRRWVATCAQESMPPSRMADECQYLIDRYTEYMNVHKMKYSHGRLRTVLSASLGCTEKLARLKFGSALESIFEFRAHAIALTEAEIQAPGREVAYIVRAQEAFK